MGIFLKEKKTGLSPPPLVDYEAYNSSVPLDFRSDSSSAFTSTAPNTTVVANTIPPKKETTAPSKTPNPTTNINSLAESGSRARMDTKLGASQYETRPRLDSKSKPLPVPSKKDNSSQKRARAQYDYDAEEDNELSFKEGDIIIITKIDDSGWWEGSLGSKTGMFPGNYVELIADETEKSATKPLPLPTKSNQNSKNTLPKKERKCKAIFDFSGDGDDELSISEGDIITILSEAEGWILGVNQKGSQGLFPANHVEAIN